jgi:bacillithiol biosynthesis deacetylase BshB1
MKLDILAIGAHPDDVELSCSGTLYLHKQKGFKTGIVDLTQGELGSRGSVAIRQQESSAASEILQLDIRENLNLRDGFFKNDEEHQLKLISLIRKYKPNIVLGTAIKDRHPDHGRSSELIADACFLSGLLKIETELDGQSQAPWRPKRIFNYVQDQYIEPDFIIDISEVFDIKVQSILAYNSQFFYNEGGGPKTYISTDEYLNTVKYRNVMMGKKIGVNHGEGFVSRQSSLGLKDFSCLVLPEFV